VKVAEQVLGFSQELVTVQVTVLLPPHAAGPLVPPLCVRVALQPPLLLTVPSHATKAASTCVCVWQAATVVPAGQVNVTLGALFTVNVAEQVLFASQELVTVQVTVLLPPHAAGPVVPPLCERAALQPPLLLTVPNQVTKASSTCAWVWQAATLVLAGQVKVTLGALVTVKVAEQVLSASQELVSVHVTVLLPPQADGPVVPPLRIRAGLQPPLVLAVSIHATYAASTCACVWQAATVVLAGQVKVTLGAVVTVNVAEQVLGVSQELVTVQVTVLLPPHAAGPLVPPLCERAALQPPLLLTVPSHALNAASTCACVWQAATVVLAGQVKVTLGAVVTVNVAAHVSGAPQVLVAVNVTVVEPPHAGGAPVLLLDTAVLQPPPVRFAVASHVVNAAFTCVCVWQAGIVVFWAQAIENGCTWLTLNEAEQVLGASQELVTVNITVLVPPHLSGAPVLLLVTLPRLQPPLADTVPSHVLYKLFTSVCVKHCPTVVDVGQVNVTLLGALTVKLLVQVWVAAQELVTV
jgi:ATP-dependent protease HslVU (ClpYQ) peptidase subunit